MKFHALIFSAYHNREMFFNINIFCDKDSKEESHRDRQKNKQRAHANKNRKMMRMIWTMPNWRTVLLRTIVLRVMVILKEMNQVVISGIFSNTTPYTTTKILTGNKFI